LELAGPDSQLKVKRLQSVQNTAARLVSRARHWDVSTNSIPQRVTLDRSARVEVCPCSCISAYQELWPLCPGRRRQRAHVYTVCIYWM